MIYLTRSWRYCKMSVLAHMISTYGSDTAGMSHITVRLYLDVPLSSTTSVYIISCKFNKSCRGATCTTRQLYLLPALRCWGGQHKVNSPRQRYDLVIKQQQVRWERRRHQRAGEWDKVWAAVGQNVISSEFGSNIDCSIDTKLVWVCVI